MTFKSYITPVIKYWWLLATAVLVAVVSSYIVTSLQAPVYQTRATLLVGRAVFEANPSSTDLYLGQQLASYYADFGGRQEVRDATMQALGLNRLPQYTVLPVPNSQLIEIVVVDTFPARAQAVANELANQLVTSSPTNRNQGSERQAFINEQISYLEGKITETLAEIDKAEKQLSEMNSARQIADAQEEIAALQTKLAQLQNNYAALLANTEQGAANTLSVIETAPLPVVPIGPNTTMVVGLSALVALMLALVAAYLLEFLDDTLKSTEEVVHLLGLPVLANIPVMQSKDLPPAPNKKDNAVQNLLSRLGFSSQTPKNGQVDPDAEKKMYIYSSSYPRSAVADEFRSLRINLDFAGIDLSLRTILVTSPDAAEGKTSVATNLAIVMAQGGKKVILLDTDFRRPSVDRHFQIDNDKGLSDIFLENLSLNDVMRKSNQEFLSIITTGITPPNPVDLLSSHKIDQILAELRNISDVVIIDGPPLMFPDATALSAKVDSVVMVVRHSVTRKNLAQARLQQLRQVGARILGVVMNEIPGKGMSQYGSYKDYYKKAGSESKSSST